MCALLAKKYQAVERDFHIHPKAASVGGGGRSGTKNNDYPGDSKCMACHCVSAPVLHARMRGGDEEAEVLLQQREQL